MNDRPAILVTGGAGYIGSHCCRALAAAGYHPVVFDNFSTGHRSFVTGSLVTGDLADKAALARAFAQHDIVAVMHFAASSLVGESVADPQKYYVNNVGRHAVAAGCDARGGMPSPGVFLDRRGLWQRRQQGAAGELSLARRSIPTAPRNG